MNYFKLKTEATIIDKAGNDLFHLIVGTGDVVGYDVVNYFGYPLF